MSRARQHAALLASARTHEEAERLALLREDRAQASRHRSRAIALRRKAANLFKENFCGSAKDSVDIQK